MDAPSAFLFKPQHSIVAGEIESVSDSAFVLRVREMLHRGTGEADTATLRLALSPRWLESLEPGQQVLVAYTRYGRSPTRRKTLDLIAAGPLVLVSAGLEPALFADTPATRALMGGKPAAVKLASRAYLDAELRGLRSSDPALQRFHAAEIALRQPRLAEFTVADRAALARFASNPDGDSAARATLINIAAANPDVFGGAWPEQAALRVLATAPVDEAAGAASSLAHLVHSSFEVLSNADRDVPIASAQRWILSPQLGLAESALLSIRRNAPDTERDLVERVLAQECLSADSREFLRDHLRRLAIMQDALAAARAGAHEKG